MWNFLITVSVVKPVPNSKNPANREPHDSPLFRAGDNPVIPLDSAQAVFMDSIFREMLAVYHADYPYKSGLIRNCISVVLHEALRIQPPGQAAAFQNGAGRVTHLINSGVR